MNFLCLSLFSLYAKGFSNASKFGTLVSQRCIKRLCTQHNWQREPSEFGKINEFSGVSQFGQQGISKRWNFYNFNLEIKAAYDCNNS